MNHHRRRVQVGGADASRITDDPIPLRRSALSAAREIAEGEVE